MGSPFLAAAGEAGAVRGTARVSGQGQAEGDRGLEGRLDDVQIYDFALDADGVARLYTGVMGPLCAVYPEYDYNKNCVVDLGDLAIFASDGLSCGFFPTCVDTMP